ncbi:Peroxiredoxin Q [Colletotrichum fructicola Nara gc5]|uniref:Peroxiredoxin Q n=1 Tax=Colletotrichum fructicola (strain Nara gc5) TaxID=1213859 RepID=A0A7J6J871_COLFN|nr:Peroxiredoxin Q [Colletotrichum fructicola Nara gc5]
MSGEVNPKYTLTLASSLPSNLPPPIDDGACDHLPGLALPSIPLPTAGDPSTKIDVSTLPGLVLIFVYPRSAAPGEVIPPEWDAIPGARGCTPQACSYRDKAARLAGAGVAHLFGVSAQTAEVQREFREREHLPYELLSDAGLEMARGLGLPTFEYGGARLLKRITMAVEGGRVVRVWYPVFPADRNVQEVLEWLEGRGVRGRFVVTLVWAQKLSNVEGAP